MSRETVDGFRLSPTQRRLWGLMGQEDAGPFRVQAFVSLDGALDRELLADALARLVARHEILRTTFQRLPGMEAPLQVIAEALETRDRDLSGGDLPPGDGWLESAAAEEFVRPLDVSRGPVLRALLLRLAPSRHGLLLTLPALCADSASLRLLTRELAALYAAGTGGDAGLAEAMQFADVAEWQNRLLESPESRSGLEFWRSRLSGLSAPTLPFAMGSPSEGFFAPRSVRFEIPEAAIHRLPSRAVELGVEIEDLLLAAWRLLLARISGSPEIPVAYAAPGRRFEELENAVGPCARLLPLSAEAREDAPFSESARGCARIRREQEGWQDYFDRNALRADGSTPAFFPYAFEAEAGLEVSAAGLDFEIRPGTAIGDRFELALRVARGAEAWTAAIDYDAGRFRLEDVRALSEELKVLMLAAAADSETPANRLPILPASERGRVLVEFNPVAAGSESARPVHRLFEEHARQRPGEVAVVAEDGCLTYAELDRLSNAVAARLAAMGVAAGSPVPLFVDRTTRMVAGLLGILKAGGAYVPLDPAVPPERLAFLLEDTGASVVVTQSNLAGRLPVGSLRILDLDEPLTPSPQSPASEDNAASLAYVLFTSGSTGKPKGVAVEHRQLSSYVGAVLAALGSPEAASFATVSTLGADLGNTAIFPALCSGGRLHVISQDRAWDAEALAEEFSRNPVDYLKIVPSHLSALLSASRPERILPRRGLVLGGEASSWGLVERIERVSPDLDLFNHYGPTEATVGATMYRIPKPRGPQASAGVPVGRPLPHARIYVLDPEAKPVPVWAVGELWIGGEGVARGYWNRPELTAESFQPDPFAGQGRMYRTGDLARWLPDGIVELLGRTDDQVKIRGFRVEPGEIEAALLRDPRIREAVVLAREGERGEKRLVAYVVATAEPGQLAGELRTLLSGTLPEIMIPSAIVVLPRLPLTPNGKIDRRALPDRASGEPAVSRDATAPRTEVERVLTRVWEDVLGVGSVGIHENFFDLGGDSILGIQVIARAAQAGVRLAPRLLFAHQTVAELATAAVAGRSVPAEQGTVEGDVPLTPIQRWFFDAGPLDPHHYNQAIFLEVRRALPVGVIPEAARRLIQHHDALRLRFSRRSGAWRQWNAPTSDEAFSRHDLSGVPAADRSAAIEAEAARLQASLDLSAGPIARFALFELGPREPARLLILVHHLAIDGVSWRLLLEDLDSACRDAAAGQTVQLPGKTTSFRSWSRRLTALARSPALESELEFWLEQEQRPVSPLPVDQRLGEDRVGSGRVVRVALTPSQTRAVLQDIPAAFATQVNDALLAAALVAFSEWTGEARLRVDLEGHGREELFEDADLTRTVGWFTTRFPVVLEAADPSDPVETLRSVREILRRVPRRGIGYGLLRYLGGDRAASMLGTIPPPEVSFNYLGQFDRALPETALFRLAGESTGPTRSPRQARRHRITIDGKVLDGRLQFGWGYSESFHLASTIQRLADRFQAALTGLAEIAASRDLVESGLSREDLDVLFRQVGQAGVS